MIITNRDLHLEMLEEKGDWEGAILYLFSEFRTDSNNKYKLIRLGLECWYVLTAADEILNNNGYGQTFVYSIVNPYSISPNGLNSNDLANLLSDTWKIGNEKFIDSAEYCIIYGYMESLFPYYFFNQADKRYSATHTGEWLLDKAYSLRPEDSIVNVIYMRSISEDISYPQHFSDEVNSAFQGQSGIETYFKRVLLSP
jgi:hypothetical protein